MASYINYSCFSNVSRAFIGDMMLVHAQRDMPAGTELVWWYNIPRGRDYEETQSVLSQNWGFKCSCVICLDLKITPAKLLRRREVLLGDLYAAAEAPGGIDVAKGERLLEAIEKTYKAPPDRVPRLALWDPYLLLTRIYQVQDRPEKVVTLSLKLLASLGFIIRGGQPRGLPAEPPLEVVEWGVVVDSVVETWLHLWMAYATVAPTLCEAAEKYAKTAYRIVVGEDDTFDESYGEQIRQKISCCESLPRT